jgi:uncharacterized protein YcbX
MRLRALYRYPVKGLSPEALDQLVLQSGQYFPGDRLYAIENGPSGFDPATPVHQPKTKFLMLMRNARLAALTTRYDPQTTRLSIEQDGIRVAAGELATEEGRAIIERFFEAFCANELHGRVRVLSAADGFRFTDSRSGFVSLLNLASVDALAEQTGRRLDPLRFRANLHIEGMQAWDEFSLVGQKVRAGSLELEIIKRIDRCAAIDVVPGQGVRDTALVADMERGLGHHDCGIYARIVAGGPLRIGDELTVSA